MQQSSQLLYLRQKLLELFDESELRTLCFDIGIEHSSLRGENKVDRVIELIGYCERRSQLARLISECRKQRPNASWPSITQFDLENKAEPPFKGLQPFEVEDASIFFGRESLVTIPFR